MPRYIDADALIEDIQNYYDWESVDGITAKTVLMQTITDIRNEPTMTDEELKAEAERRGYGLHKSMKGCCSCMIPREQRLKAGRKKCLEYEEYEITRKSIYTHCRRKDDAKRNT